MEDRLTINKEYAARYVKRKQAEELSKRKYIMHDHAHRMPPSSLSPPPFSPSFLPPATVRDKYGAEGLDSESSTSEEEDDDAEVMQQISGSS